MTVAGQSNMKQRGATTWECPRGAVDISRKPIKSDERLCCALLLCINAAIREMRSNSCEWLHRRHLKLFPITVYALSL